MNDFEKFKGEIEKLEIASMLKAKIVHIASMYLQGRDGSEGTFYAPDKMEDSKIISLILNVEELLTAIYSLEPNELEKWILDQADKLELFEGDNSLYGKPLHNFNPERLYNPKIDEKEIK